MTISPPANVKVEQEKEFFKVLASGFDTIFLALDVEWKESHFFGQLEALKKQAKSEEQPAAGMVNLRDEAEAWPFNVLANGSKGYEWVLLSREFALKVGNWPTPRSRPSVMVEIRSEALWHQGPWQATDRVCMILAAVGAQVLSIKASRADPCVDLLMPSGDWNMALLDHAVTRAVYTSPHLAHRKLTGISIGKGIVSARLYDKPLEIATQSRKEWMYDVWGQPVAEGYKIIRVEFQLRREAIKSLGIDSLHDLLTLGGNLWSYCTTVWLKFQDDPAKHHTQQETLPWWKVVQAGFKGAQGALVRWSGQKRPATRVPGFLQEC